MPDLDRNTIDELKKKLEKKINSETGYHSPVFLAAGGSAAVFKVETPSGPRAYKVFDPRFINEEEGSKERHRLSLQSRLIGHNCETLVQTYNVTLAENTAFVEMEYIEWPQLKNVLRDIPDDAIQSLIVQLIDAVKYLESLNIVHRDIKPENIHISPDFKKMKLLDLGVVREFDPGPDVEETDHGNSRFFLATAQYSSPEYLFRLDAPSKDLWQALNIYQVGAVLHDLIVKDAIFQAEIDTGNRWLVAKAVLLKKPKFIDSIPSRLAKLKAIATKCLTKDMYTRLQIVSWNDFYDTSKDPLKTLRDRLESQSSSADSRVALEIKFHRTNIQKIMSQKIRDSLISTCKTDLPFSLTESSNNQRESYDLIFSLENNITLLARIIFDWQDGIYAKNANILMSCCLTGNIDLVDMDSLSKKIICTCDTDVNVDEQNLLLCSDIANAVIYAIDLIASTEAESISQLKNIDLVTKMTESIHEY